MSLLPYLFGRPRQLRNQHFGLVLTPDDFLTDILDETPSLTVSREYLRPWRHVKSALNDAGSSIKADKDKFQVNLDVQHFSPEEVTVKVVDGDLVIEGKHEEKQDEHGYVSRQFSRRYTLPENCNGHAVESKLSSDGVLTITAPRRQALNSNERLIPITHTGPVRRKLTDSKSEENQNGADSELAQNTPQKKRKR